MKAIYKDYYEFNDSADEVIFHRHDMPSPWINYLTNGVFFTMISQAGRLALLVQITRNMAYRQV